MDRLRCVLERVTYHNDENGYTVARCKAKGYTDLITLVGSLPEAHAGTVLLATGEWKVDARYGQQFVASSVEVKLPATAYGMEKYLSSGLIKGIGPVFAKKIVNQFGEDTLRIIEEAPQELLKVPGLGKRRVKQIIAGWAEQKEIHNVMLFLQSHDVNTSHATRIFRQYGADSIQIVTENPYRMADDIWGIGFKTADTIAMKLGFTKDRDVRIRSGILYSLSQISDQGHCYATYEQLLEEGIGLLEVTREQVDQELRKMVKRKDVIPELIPLPPDAPGYMNQEAAVYLPPFYYAEAGVVLRLRAIQAKPLPPSAGDIPSPPGITYDEIQQSAIRKAMTSKILILTGGPGTGKTTTTLGMITCLRHIGRRVLLAAPTGRAAKRLSEATHMEAKTIHRLLEFRPPQGYQRNAEKPLEGDVLIVDECSMIDLLLMNNLLKAVPDGMQLILVGDVDQLPSVGAGSVLRDLINSGCFDVIRLTRIFRQAQQSQIIMNAHRINEGKMPEIRNGRASDFFFIEEEEPEKAVDTIVNLVKTRLPRHFSVRPSEVQVLTPMQRTVVGAAPLNTALQGAINPSAESVQKSGIFFRLYDKVMQIRNNYDKEVFNGDIGRITRIDAAEKKVAIRFDDRVVEYDVSELDEVTLAYATTIHKAQGSEYPVVVIPLFMSHYTMLQRNLLYTGVTRAKRGLVLVGTKKALQVAVHTVSSRKRNTMLAEKLQGLVRVLPPRTES